MTEELLNEIVYRIDTKGPEHSEILAKAIEKFGKAVDYEVNQVANLLFGAFVETVCQQEFPEQIKQFHSGREYLTEMLCDSRIWARNYGTGTINMVNSINYAKEVEKAIEAWDKENLNAWETKATA